MATEGGGKSKKMYIGNQVKKMFHRVDSIQLYLMLLIGQLRRWLRFDVCI